MRRNGAVGWRYGNLVSFLNASVTRVVVLTEYAAHLIFWSTAGTQNSVGGPLLTLYIIFISYGPRGIWIMNLQKVYDLWDDAQSMAALLH
jgi:hypothetical protein